MNIVAWLEALAADVKYGARQLVLNPGFTTVAVLSLALGVGANTAIFQLINALRLRTLPAVEAPWELATVARGKDFTTSGWYSSRHPAFTYAQYEAVRRAQEAFTDVMVFGPTRFNLVRGGEARYAEGLWVSTNFLDVLGVRPAMGRGLARVEDEADCSQAGVVLSHAFWQREFGGRAGVLGQDMFLQGRTLPIVGITPPDFIGLEPGRQFDVAVPICVDTLLAEDARARRLERKDAWWLTIVGRLKPGWNATRASAHLTGLSPAIFRETVPPSYRPDTAEKYLKNTFVVEDASAGLSALHRAYKDPLWILLTVAGLVLLIACANLANLLLARASARQREMAVRQAVGASRARLIAQLCTESLLLAGLGALLGLGIAHAAGRGLIAFLTTQDQPIVLTLGLDRNLFLFTTALTALTCVLFGVAPAVKATSTPPASAMSGARGTAQSGERHHLRRALVVAQVGLSLVLLCGALLFAQTLRNLLTTESGMVPEGVLVASVDARLPTLKPEHRRLVFDQIEERIAAQSGVVSVAQVTLSPFGGSGWNGDVRAKGGADEKESWFTSIGPGYFGTLKTTLLAGREFTPQDSASAPRVAIVNEQFVKSVFGGGNPIGRTFTHEAPAGEQDLEYEVVGLVRNTKYNGLREDFRAIAFLAEAQQKDPSDSMTFLVRSRAPMGTTIAGIRQLMTEMQQGLLIEFRVLDDQVAETVMRERLMATVSGAFGILAVVLSTLGLYGVMSYMVARRRSEIGVRLALGASSVDVLRLVFLEAARLVAIGLVVGLAGAWWGARYAESLIFGLQAHDARTLIIGCTLLASTGALAALVPALRAIRYDPAVVLRAD